MPMADRKASFKKHAPSQWCRDLHDFSPSPQFDLYADGGLPPPSRFELGPDGRRREDRVFFARVPAGDAAATTRWNYACARALTREVASDVDGVDGGKVLVKPNNTGFVGIFSHDPRLRATMERNGVVLHDPDQQPFATQPAVVAGVVDAFLFDLGAAEVHVGENMLWSGGTPRAFWETGYAQYFSRPVYDGKVWFVDFYEGDDAPLAERPIPTAGMEVGAFRKVHPPKALFDEGYDLFFLASIAKVHNCSFYTLAAKNSSISWNPRKRQGDVLPRWHAHGLPLDPFDAEFAGRLVGRGFDPKWEYEVLGVTEFGSPAKTGGQAGTATVTRVVVTDGLKSTAPVRTYPSYGGRVLQVDPHHHAGSNLLTSQLGVIYLVTRSNGMFASVVKALRESGTEVACLVSGVVGQEGEGPLVYGSLRRGGFAAASRNFTALERCCVDAMFGSDEAGFAGFASRWNAAKAEALGFEETWPALEADSKVPWTLAHLGELLSERWQAWDVPVELLDWTGPGSPPLEDATQLHLARVGPPFRFTDSFYCSLPTWLELAYCERGVREHFSDFVKKGVEVPLVPGVVR
ncbi:MAG: hypothetical protein Kow0069_30100 [Promethearchaeota archaeon]